MKTNLRILVIDDEEEVLELLDTYLGSKGFEIETCKSAQEGLDALRDASFDLVLSDIKMADMSGLEFLKAARATYPTMGIILMTGMVPLRCFTM